MRRVSESATSATSAAGVDGCWAGPRSGRGSGWGPFNGVVIHDEPCREQGGKVIMEVALVAGQESIWRKARVGLLEQAKGKDRRARTKVGDEGCDAV